MFVRAYLRASTDEQDANCARGELKAFASLSRPFGRVLVCRERERCHAGELCGNLGDDGMR